MCCITSLERWCATDELSELWSVEYELMEEIHSQASRIEERRSGPRDPPNIR